MGQSALLLNREKRLGQRGKIMPRNSYREAQPEAHSRAMTSAVAKMPERTGLEQKERQNDFFALEPRY